MNSEVTFEFPQKNSFCVFDHFFKLVEQKFFEKGAFRLTCKNFNKSKILFTDIFLHFHKNIKLTWSHSVINEEWILIFCTLLYEICNFGYNCIINQSEVITRHCDLNKFDSFNVFLFADLTWDNGKLQWRYGPSTLWSK